jgi:membrane-associated phospholipid phosphatase
MAGLVFILAGLHFIYTWRRPDPYIGPMTGGLAAISWAGIVSGMTALAGLRTGEPLIDGSLAHADAVLGLNTPPFVAWLAQYRSICFVLEIAYVSTVPLVFATIILLGCLRRDILIWELCFVFSASAASCAFLSGLMPAVGAFSYYGTPPDILALLPAGAGRFHLPVFEAYRSGVFDTVDVRHLEGVVTFPSFHAAMALMTAYAMRNLRFLCGLCWAWSALILISTIPIGGHYAIDLVAGAAVWGTFTLLVRSRISRPLRGAEGPSA